MVSIAWLGGMVFFLLVIALHQPEVICMRDGASTEAQECAETQAALAAWQEMWNALETEGIDALAPDPRAVGVRPAGDTCGMRYRRLFRGVEARTRERFVIAAFSNDWEAKQRLLRPLLESADARIRARATIELVRVALRRGDPDQAARVLRQHAASDLPAPCEADLHYLEGRIAVHRGNPAVALDAFATASMLDPGYWNAYRDRLPILVGVLHASDQSAARCLNHARALIETLGLLPQLADDSRQFAKLARAVEKLGARSSATLLASGMAWRWAGQETHGLKTLARALDTPALLPAACEREMRARITIALEDR